MSPTDEMFKTLGLRKHETTGRKLATQPTGLRAIDREAGVRTRPMRVIVASVSRCGTLSMFAALQKLGFHPYHMAEAFRDPARSLTIASEAIEASCMGKGKPYGKAEFDKWIGDYDATSDAPMTQLSLDLLRAYPDAKVVLSTRDPDRWRRSMEVTVIPVLSWRVWGFLAYLHPDAAAFHNFAKTLFAATDNMSRDYFVEHNERIQREVPADQLLNFRLGQDGWKELCDFLDVPVPEGDFVKVNEGSSGFFYSFHVAIVNHWLVKGIWNKTKWLLPVAVVAGAWYANQRGIINFKDLIQKVGSSASGR